MKDTKQKRTDFNVLVDPLQTSRNEAIMKEGFTYYSQYKVTLTTDRGHTHS